jgi:hypothetical protein
VSPKDAESLATLMACLEAGRAAVRLARVELIEALGDHLCGGGPGPEPAELEAFEQARQAEARLERELADLAIVLAMACLHPRPGEEAGGVPQLDDRTRPCE